MAKNLSVPVNFVNLCHVWLSKHALLSKAKVYPRFDNTKKRRDMSSDTDTAAKRERNTTITIVTSSFIFLLLALPNSVASIIVTLQQELFGRGARYEYVHLIVVEISSSLTIISFITDFFTYMTLSSTFRKTFYRLMNIKQDAQRTGQTDTSNNRT